MPDEKKKTMCEMLEDGHKINFATSICMDEPILNWLGFIDIRLKTNKDCSFLAKGMVDTFKTQL
jgi:hypothetical protein